MPYSHDSLLNAPLGRPCVDCHAFEFMQRALQDLKKTAYNLDTRVRKHSISFFLLMWKIMLWIKVDKVDGFCTRHSVNCTVLSSKVRLGNYIPPLYAIICGILLPWGIRDTRKFRKE